MRNKRVVRGAVLCVALVAGAAGAQTQTTAVPPRWTVDSGQTVGEGANVVRAQIAWPGLWLDYIYGLNPTFDIGGRLALNWGGPAGELNYCVSNGFVSACGGSTFNFDFQLLLRKQIAEFSGLKLAATFNPGFLLYTAGNVVGINLPLGAQLGIPVNDKLIFNASFELAMYLTFANGNTNFTIPLLFGGGVEYAVMPELLVTAKLAMGPSIPTHANTATSFALETLVGVAYKFH
jgi:hypothetical protein